MTNPAIVAQFVLDPKGEPVVAYQDDYTHYRMKLMVKNTPEDIYAVTYELHETYYEPVIESRRRNEDFVLNLTSYGDYPVRATIRGKQRDTLIAYLSNALTVGHEGDISPAITAALDYIKTN